MDFSDAGGAEKKRAKESLEDIATFKNTRRCYAELIIYIFELGKFKPSDMIALSATRKLAFREMEYRQNRK